MCCKGKLLFILSPATSAHVYVCKMQYWLCPDYATVLHTTASASRTPLCCCELCNDGSSQTCFWRVHVDTEAHRRQAAGALSAAVLPR